MLEYDAYKIKYRFFFKSAIIPCAIAAELKTTKLHVKNVHVQIKKSGNDERVVQPHAGLKT